MHLTRKAHEIGARRLPRRHARTTTSRRSAASSSTSRRSPTVSDRPIIVYNIPGRVVVNIEPETIVELAEDPDGHGGQAGERRSRPGAPHRRGRGPRPLRGRRQPPLPVPRARRRRRRLRPHARRRAAGEGDDPALQGRATTSRRGESTRSSRRATTCSRSQTNPIAIKAALNLLGHEVGGPPAAARRGDRGRARARPRLPRAPRRCSYPRATSVDSPR